MVFDEKGLGSLGVKSMMWYCIKEIPIKIVIIQSLICAKVV